MKNWNVKEVNLKNENYRLVFNKVGFWVDANNNDSYLANPTDVEYYRQKYGVKTVRDENLGAIDNELELLWNKRIIPILDAVLKSDYVPCTEFNGTSYWECAVTPYFGVNILHADKFIGQHCGIFEQSNEEFKAAMKEDRKPWKVQEIETEKYHFIGDSNSNWQILLK